MYHYCASLTKYSRLVTREVRVGNLLMGGNHPIRIQTMTTTDTMDTMATVEQAIRCIEAGAELIRITAPSKKEAENLLHIKNELRKRGYATPLVADIHFTPNAAEIAARIVEKVRVNPGNYVDKKKFEQLEYSDEAYKEEMERIKEKFTPLVRICKEFGTAMRIGTNHGSLSDRIMSRYGDTAIGMVESAMEFLRIARAEDYHNIVLSMKSSNPQVMVHAYRLLIHHMMTEFRECYPLHLGVTEAGDGEDGRIKSSIGIGTLLEDGIGDTIRVSLTEDPELEIPVCKKLVNRYHDAALKSSDLPEIAKLPYQPFGYQRRITHQMGNIGSQHVPVVVGDFRKCYPLLPQNLSDIGYHYNASLDKWKIDDIAADFLFCNEIPEFPLPGTLQVITPFSTWNVEKNAHPILTTEEYQKNYLDLKEVQKFVWVDCYSANGNHMGLSLDLVEKLKNDTKVALCLSSQNSNATQSIRRMFVALHEHHLMHPVILMCATEANDSEAALIHYAVETGAMFIDGLGDGITLVYPDSKKQLPDLQKILNSIAFGILQATRTRISKTEYISCPSCGRTLFDLQETTAKIRAVTHHLKGVKIAIMGCIVNGPGEMADADFGYVGSGVGKITLYKNKEIVKRNINHDVAVDELIKLLKENNAWVDPVV